MNGNLVWVGMGEARAGRPGQEMAALLGSCVAIVLVWLEVSQCCGLAHCLLPHSDQPGWKLGARYVNHAVPALLAQMGVRRKQLGEVQAIVTGGANMLGGAGVYSGVGTQNVEQAERCLQAQGLQVVRREVGRRRGRTVRIDCTTYCVSIAKVERQAEELEYASL
ncbi:chemotaxis protein CheD [Massilia sp. B-10]|nr:chemotaxis protein CheD [Massilia sp. B-10]